MISEVLAWTVFAASIVGWIVVGTQRVNEKLLEERRVAYVALIDVARRPTLVSPDERARLRGSGSDAAAYRRELEHALAAAELVATKELHESGALEALRTAALEGGVDEEYRRAFVDLVREETVRNSFVFRLIHFRWRKRHLALEDVREGRGTTPGTTPGTH